MTEQLTDLGAVDAGRWCAIRTASGGPTTVEVLLRGADTPEIEQVAMEWMRASKDPEAEAAPDLMRQVVKLAAIDIRGAVINGKPLKGGKPLQAYLDGVGLWFVKQCWDFVIDRGNYFGGGDTN